MIVKCDVYLCNKKAPSNPYVIRRRHPVSPVFVKGAGRIAVAARSKAWVCGRSVAGIEVSNPAEGIEFRFLCFIACCVGGGLCEELITRQGESWWVCLCVCDLETSTIRRPGPEMGSCATG